MNFAIFNGEKPRIILFVDGACHYVDIIVFHALNRSSNTGLFTAHCYVNEVGLHTNPSSFWSDDGQH